MFPWKTAARSAVAVLLTCVSTAYGSVVIMGTRVIYPAGEREVSIKLSNEGSSPALVQTWLDKGDPKAQPGAVQLPFTLMPPLFRMEPRKGQTLRLIYTGEPLPQDKESVFWLNVLEVPPKAQVSTENENLMQLAFRYRIKIFFRPKALPDNPDAAATQLTWTPVPEGGEMKVRVDNPSAYHVTIVNIDAGIDGKSYSDSVGGMVDPGGNTTFLLKKSAVTPAAGPFEVKYRYINDYGAEINATFPKSK
ncbi:MULTISPECIES: fimbria/pilus periplasmic chaperone [Burkholderia]|uniref:Molecular chaperone EcpD n=1 Tax=Burkholderia cepacia TaxID=292 RepID=A0AA88YVX8_BURCE|nr:MULTISPECIES: fimbria/pilus periplasmic chaperone [Burkholderia]KGB92159.1 hypothetical protein DM43_168 [Burkholderia cepacia]